MSDLRALLRKYERAQARADAVGLELARAVRDRIRYGGRGEASACARELGWSRGRLDAWMRRAGRDAEPALTGSEAARPVRGGRLPLPTKAARSDSGPSEPMAEREPMTETEGRSVNP